MKTEKEIKSMIRKFADNYLHFNNPESEVDVIYNDICRDYGEDQILDGEEPFLSEFLESRTEQYYMDETIYFHNLSVSNSKYTTKP